MSHNPERKIKVCLNCGSDLNGRFCHVCGQENIEPKESFTGLVSHFFNDITHFDGSFFKSLKLLLSRPGFLSSEWTKGRRASYLHPVRMYIFTSAVFFLVFFSVYHFDGGELLSVTDKKKARNEISSRDRETLNPVLPNFDSTRANPEFPEKNSIDHDSTGTVRKKNGFTTKLERSREAYDSAQALLPSAERDGWFIRQLHYKFIEEMRSGSFQTGDFFQRLMNKFLHLLPQLLFVSLPLYALLLKLLYIRRRKDLYYSDHAIYSIHIFVFRFIALLAFVGFSQLKALTNWSGFSVPSTIMMVCILVYNVFALKRFYGQSWSKTLLKSFILAFLAANMVLFLFMIFLMLSFFQL